MHLKEQERPVREFLPPFISFGLCRLLISTGTGSGCREQGPLSACGAWASHPGGFSRCRAWAPGGRGSEVAAHRLSCTAACGVFPDTGSNGCPLHCTAVSYVLGQQASPATEIFCKSTHDSLQIRAAAATVYSLRHFQLLVRSPPGSSVHGILQAGIQEWAAISFSRGSSQPRDQTQVSCIAGRFFTTEPPRKPKLEQRLWNWVEEIHQILHRQYHWEFFSIHLDTGFQSPL